MVISVCNNDFSNIFPNYLYGVFIIIYIEITAAASKIKMADLRLLLVELYYIKHVIIRENLSGRDGQTAYTYSSHFVDNLGYSDALCSLSKKIFVYRFPI